MLPLRKLLRRMTRRWSLDTYILHIIHDCVVQVEEVVRKNMLAELQRDRAEAKADRNDAKIQSE